MITRVILVRHGQSSYNVEQRIQGRLDLSVLTEKGIETARQVGQALKEISLAAAYCSPLQRAKQTAEIILSSMENPPTLQPQELLREVDLPLWEGMRRDDVKVQFPNDYDCWKNRPAEFFMLLENNGEITKHYPVVSLFAQAKQFWHSVLTRHQGETILVVAHNGINRCLTATATGLTPEYYHSIQQSNCGVSVFNFDSSCLNDLSETDDLPTNRGSFVQLESLNITTHVGVQFPKPREGHSGPRLLLVRHGETEWNRQGKFQGQIDVPLNDNGRSQAAKTAEFLQNVHLDFAVSSPMLRPKETAEIILKYHPHLNLELDAGLCEISHGLWEGKFEKEIEQDYPGLLAEWKTAPENVQMPEGENLQDVWQRAIATWDQIVRSHSGVGMVVAHDAINKAILCHLFNLGPEHFWKFKQGNGGVTVIDYPQGADAPPVLEVLNITSHLSGSILDKTAAGAL